MFEVNGIVISDVAGVNERLRLATHLDLRCGLLDLLAVSNLLLLLIILDQTSFEPAVLLVIPNLD